MKFWDHQQNARAETRRLLLAFALAVAVLVLAVHGALVLAWWLMAALLPVHLPFPAGFLAANVGVSLLLVLGGWWVETSNLRAGGVKLAQRVGARELRASLSHAEQRLANVVDELCIAAHMPRPQVMMLPRTDAINAFAAGWDEQDAVVAVTQGALDYLNREEMQGMVAHELSHLHEGDTRLKMRLAGMVFGLELVYNFGDTMRERRGLAWWFGSAIMLAGFAGWLTGRMLKAAVLRQREHLADARAVQWTRSKDGLGGVLRKVMAQRRATPAGYEARGHSGLAHPAVQHMLLVDAGGVHGPRRGVAGLAGGPVCPPYLRAPWPNSAHPLNAAASSAPSAGNGTTNCSPTLPAVCPTRCLHWVTWSATAAPDSTRISVPWTKRAISSAACCPCLSPTVTTTLAGACGWRWTAPRTTCASRFSTPRAPPPCRPSKAPSPTNSRPTARRRACRCASNSRMNTDRWCTCVPPRGTRWRWSSGAASMDSGTMRWRRRISDTVWPSNGSRRWGALPCDSTVFGSPLSPVNRGKIRRYFLRPGLERGVESYEIDS